MSYEYTQDPRYIPIPGVKQPVGLGDAIARMTHALRIKQCEPCKRRQEWLNQRFMLGRRR
jgi:hypothetical protein